MIITLTSNRLEVQIASVGSIYRRPRFDWSGNIKQVKLDQTHTFCSADNRPPQQICGGFGLMNEFVLSDQQTFGDPIYDGLFIKMGVGILRNHTRDELYSQKTDYPIWQQLEYSESYCYDCYTVLAVQRDFCGYAYSLCKEITIKDNELTISYTVRNTGSKHIYFEEYNHNFFCLNKKGRADKHYLQLDYTPILSNTIDFKVNNNQILLNKLDSGAVHTEITGFGEQPGSMTLVDCESGLSVSETLSEAASRFNLWVMRDVICPELFIRQSVPPDSSRRWFRKYCFI